MKKIIEVFNNVIILARFSVEGNIFYNSWISNNFHIKKVLTESTTCVKKVFIEHEEISAAKQLLLLLSFCKSVLVSSRMAHMSLNFFRAQQLAPSVCAFFRFPCGKISLSLAASCAVCAELKEIQQKDA